MNEEIAKELEEIHAKAVELTEKWFPETSKYPRDKRLTTITIMKYLIQLEKLRIELKWQKLNAS